MRIVFLDSWSRDPSQGSGTAVSISSLRESLLERGHEVRVPPAADLPLWPRRIVYNLRARARIGARDPDLLVGFDLDGFLLPRDLDVPFVTSLKGIAADEARFERGTAAMSLRLAAALEARNARRADLVLVPSAYSARVAQRAYGLDRNRLRVVPESVDPGTWAELRADPPRRPARHPTIVTVARQYPRKNTARLVEALPLVARAVPEARLRIVGGGPELPALREQVRRARLEDRVDILGPLPTMDAVREEYFGADCFCLPTLQEGFGIAFLEAMSAGLPVVGGRAGAVPEVVPDGEAGILVDPREPAEIAEALIAVLTDHDRAERMGRRGIERAATFNPERTARLFLDAVEELHLPREGAGRRG